MTVAGECRSFQVFEAFLFPVNILTKSSCRELSVVVVLISMTDTGLDAVVIENCSLPLQFLGAPIVVQLSIASSYLTEMSWSLFGRDYIYSLTYWRSGSINKIAKQFLDWESRDPKVFGTVIRQEDANRSFEELRATRDQKVKVLEGDGKVLQINCSGIIMCCVQVNIVKQAVIDVMRTIERIVMMHGSAVVDYAIWYREMPKEPKDYSESITHIACNKIVHIRFMAPSVTWSVVQFNHVDNPHSDLAAKDIIQYQSMARRSTSEQTRDL